MDDRIEADRAEQEAIDPEFAPEQFDGLDPVRLVRALAVWQERKNRLEAELKSVNQVYDHLRLQRIPTAFDDAGIEMLRVEGIGRCNLTSDCYVRIAAAAREEAHQWLRDNGRGDLIVDYVLPSTLKASIKKAVSAGVVIPDCISFVPFTRAVITRG